MPYQGSLLTMRVMTPAGEPVGNAVIFAKGLNYKGRSMGRTDAEGHVSVLVQFDSRVKIEVQLAGPVATDGLDSPSDEWNSPRLPCVTLGRFMTGASPGSSVVLGDLKIGGEGAAAAA